MEEIAAIYSALQGVAFYATQWRMPHVDTQWFVDALDARKMSRRALARHLGLDASAVSLMLRGKREMRMTEAAQIAALLGLPLTEVIAHAGVQQGKGGKVSIAGWIDGSGEVHMQESGDSIDALPGLPDGCIAVQYRTAATALEHRDGWVLIFTPPTGMAPDILDRFCIAKIRAGIIVAGQIKRGYKRGAFNIIDPVNLQDVELEWATPVLWIRP